MCFNPVMSPSNGVMTPPTSSETQPSPLSNTRMPKERTLYKRKRSQTLSPRRLKYRKLLKPSAASAPLQHCQHDSRQPLENISSVTPSQENVLRGPIQDATGSKVEFQMTGVENMGPELIVSQLPTSFSIRAPASTSGLSQLPFKRLLSSRASSSEAPAQNSICHHVGRTCALANHFILLSPCVVRMPWLTDDLLPCHGLTAIFKDVPSWMASSSLPEDNEWPLRPRRLVLVERRRTEATRNFLKQLQVEPLRRCDGEPEVVIAYDWRLLEMITDTESKSRTGGEQKPGTGARARELWKKHYIGLC